MPQPAPFPIGFIVSTFYLIISSTASNLNIRTLLDAAGYSGLPLNLVVTINNGVDVYSTSSGTAALVTGTIPVGSVLTLINNGDIRGKGGNGGDQPLSGGGQAAENGGDALSLSYDIRINNANGIIFGGGAGGSPSSGKSIDDGPGGGAGRNIGIGGQAEAGGSDGADGTFTAGGAGGVSQEDGAAPGEATNFLVGGKAIAKNGNDVVFLAGDDPSQVKGAVS